MPTVALYNEHEPETTGRMAALHLFLYVCFALLGLFEVSSYIYFSQGSALPRSTWTTAFFSGI